MTFDLTSPLASDLQVLLARWSGAIAQMMQGLPIGSVEPDGASAVALDTGEAYELSPASLTVTLGLGPGVFDHRFGLAAKRPKHLADLPDLPSDQLQKASTGGDLSLQACADDPQVAYHAIRDLTRMAKGVATTRWTVLGFGRASAGKGQTTPRNLMGFKDGTRNIKEEADFSKFVWVGDDQAWTRGGSYQVVRKIQMNIENWDSDPVGDQQRRVRAHEGGRGPAHREAGVRHPGLHEARRRRDGDPADLARRARRAREQRRGEDPPPRLQLHRRAQPVRPARRRAALPRRTRTTRSTSSRCRPGSAASTG